MDKKKQRSLNKWLRSQSRLAKRWLLATVSLGVVSSLLLLAQAGLLASILHQLIIEQVDKYTLVPQFITLAVTISLRAICAWGREVAGFKCGEQVRLYVRELILNKLNQLGPAYIKGKPAGTWATLVLEQVEEMQEFFSKYLPQMSLSVFIPLIILLVVFPLNWAAGLIFLVTAPLVPLFMALVGQKAAAANSKNFKALQRLSGHFYDRLQSMTTLRLFNRVESETKVLHGASEVFRKRTMDVLRLAFLSSAVLEFFTSISIAITAVYFGFSFIGELNFGHYDGQVTLFTGLFILILAPEFYQPLRDLGTFYHAKAQAVGAAENIVEFLNTEAGHLPSGDRLLANIGSISIKASELEIYSVEGQRLVGPLSFELKAGKTTALVGPSGAGKTTLVNAILGFLPYQGSLQINGVELKQLDQASWRKQISWVGQNPLLLHGSIRDNIKLGNQGISDAAIEQALINSHAAEFVHQHGLDYMISDRASGVSIGQAQRIALARAMVQSGHFWLLDEPTASLDANSEKWVNQGIERSIIGKTTLTITHQLTYLKQVDHIIVLDNGKIVQSGGYQALAQSEGLFSQMLNAHHISLQCQQGDLDA